MASSQLTSASVAAAEHKTVTKQSAANDPNFAVICAFLQKFSKDLGLDLPNFCHLYEWLINSEEVSPQLRELHIKLLRKTRKTVHEKSWESALSKFCFSYSAQNAWELERFGYKKSSLKVKLRIFRELLESQFEQNNKFRTKIQTSSADSLRSEPIGRDKLGYTYWLTQDDDCNIRIYQEHLDEEIWRVVATNREELVNLIARLRGNEVVLPSTDIGIVDEDTSSSNSCTVEKAPPPEEQDDSQEDPHLKVPNLRIKLGGNKKLLNQDVLLNQHKETTSAEVGDIVKSNLLTEKAGDRNSLTDIETQKKVKPLLISHSKVGLNSSNITNTFKKRSNAVDRILSPTDDAHNTKRPRPLLLDPSRITKPSKFFKGEEVESFSSSPSFDDDLDDEEIEEEDIDSAAAEEDENEEKEVEDYDEDFEAEFSEAIEDPPVFVLGNGAGRDCDGLNNILNKKNINAELPHMSAYDISYDQTCGEPIEEPVLFFCGEGYGSECLVGNKSEDNASTSQEPKAKFFFGEPGCLMLSPMKTTSRLVSRSMLECDTDEGHDQFEKKSKYKKSETLKQQNIDDNINIDKKPEFKTSVNSEKQEIKCEINGENNMGITEEIQSSGKDCIDLKKVVAKYIEPDDKLESEGVEERVNCLKDKNLAGNGDSPTSHQKTLLKEKTPMSQNNENDRGIRERPPLIESPGIDTISKRLVELTDNQTAQFVTISAEIASNRKRRLVELSKSSITRHPTSESELDAHSDQQDECHLNDDVQEDIGGKRLKMRSRTLNSEFRKKIEAKLKANIEETTSSSGEEETRHPRKIMSPKKIGADKTHALDYLEKQVKNVKSPSASEVKTVLADPFAENIKNITQESFSGYKQKPTLSEIIEKKLKKTPSKVNEEPAPSINQNSDTIFSPTKKTPITKPLKKNLLTQLRESDDNALPHKQTLNKTNPHSPNAPNSCVPNFNITDGTDAEAKAKNLKWDQRKHERCNSQNSEVDSDENQVQKGDVPEQNLVEKLQQNSIEGQSLENLQEDIKEIILKTSELAENENNSDIVKETKKVVTASTLQKDDKIIIYNNTEDKILKLKPENIKQELFVNDILSSTNVTCGGRRSSRRVGSTAGYGELPQAKRTRCGVKAATKNEIKKVEISSTNELMEENATETMSPKEKCQTADVSEADVLQKSSNNEIESNDEAFNTVKKDMNQSTTKVPQASNRRGRGLRKKGEVDTTNIIDTIDTENPIRQSRRIAQQKIREEAERRKLEEIALRTMKQELKKKKKAEKEADPTVEPSEQSSSSSDTEVETKKKLKKKCPGVDGWSSGSEEVEEPEEEDEEHHHFETDPGSPLFKSDHEFSPESELEDDAQIVPMKRARTARKEDAEDGEEDGDEEACQKCGKSDHPEWILLCDICDKGYHCSCLSPVLFYIPEGDWHCPPCQQEQLIAALEKKLNDFDELVERKRIAYEEEKLLAEEAERQEQIRLREEEEKRKERRKFKQKNRRRNDSSNKSVLESGKSEKDSKSSNESESDVEQNLSNAKNKTSLDKNKRRRLEHRNQRRKAATRGARRRRRLDRNSQSGSGSVNDSVSSNSDESSSSDSFTDSDDEPIYKLRKRRQINVSYRLNEYEDLINSALKKEMDEVAGAGNLGRGKDITTIIEADKEEKARLKQKEEKRHDKCVEIETKDLSCSNDEREELKIQGNSDDDKPLKNNLKPKVNNRKKSRKLTTLDITSEEDDGSDEDFKTCSFDDEDEDSSISASTDSDTSLEIFRRRARCGKKNQRKAARRAARERRKDKKFVVYESDEENEVKSRKKRKDDSDFTESVTDDDEISELSENIDSADLCDDTTSEESDGAWQPSKRKKQRKSGNQSGKGVVKLKKPQTKKPKRLEYSDDDISESEEEDDDEEASGIGSGKGSGKQPRSQPLIPVSSKKCNDSEKVKSNTAAKKKIKKKNSEDELSYSDSGDSTRKTRGRRYAYIVDFDDESSDGGIKPGVKRPDTPPEEREKFIKKQEEIKRMLAEKDAEGAKLAATPRLTPIKAMGAVDKRSSNKQGLSDSLSTVPLSVIRQAKVLDIDYLQRKGESIGDLENVGEEVDSEFDDADLPDDLPEDMDEDAIARMVEEEEEFGASVAAKELPAPDEVIIKTANKSKNKDTIISSSVNKLSNNPSLEALSQMQTGTLVASTATIPYATSCGLQEPARKRLPMPTIHPPLLRDQYLPPPLTQSENVLHSISIARHPSHLLQNALNTPLGQPLNRDFGIPTNPQISLTAGQNLSPSTRQLQSEHPQPSHATKQEAVGAHVSNNIESKPRGRRKKITPLRDPALKNQVEAFPTSGSAKPSEKNLTATSSTTGAQHSVTSSVSSSVIKSLGPISSATQPIQHYKSSTDVIAQPQASVITRVSHLPSSRMIFPGTDVTRFYSSLPPTLRAGTSHQITSSSQRPHRGPPLQISSVLSPPSVNSGSYGPPHARHAPSHLNPYRPPIYGNPNYGQLRSVPQATPPNLRIGSPQTSTEYLGAPRPYPPYNYYPPPPPLTSTHHPGSVGSVIVAAPSSAIQASTLSTAPPHAHTVSGSSALVDRTKSPSKVIDNIPSNSNQSTKEPEKKLMTLDVYTASNVKSPAGAESSGSQPEAADDSPSSSAQSQSKAGEFSGLVSYFSSQHDDYNT